MRRVLILLGVLLAGAASLTAAAPPAENPGALPILLGLDAVRHELKLDSLQRAVLNSLRDEYKADVRALVTPLPAPGEARVKAGKEFVRINAKYNKRALSVLNSTQRQRVREIEHQMLGGTMLAAPSVQAKLGLSDRQKQQIETLRRQTLAYVAKVNRQFEEGKIGYFERLSLLRARRLSSGTAALKVLTPVQRDAFLALGGKKLSISA